MNNSKLLKHISNIVSSLLFKDHNITYLRKFPATVISTTGSGVNLLVNVKVDPQYKMPLEIRDLKLRLGLPSVMISKIKAGTKCEIEFENADPELCFVRSFEQIEDGDVVYSFNNSNDAAVLDSKLNTFLTSLKNYLDTHTHPAPTGPTSVPTTPSPTIPDLKSVTLKVDK